MLHISKKYAIFWEKITQWKGGIPVENTSLDVQMLGGFTIRRDKTVLTVSGRSRKLCLLLARLIWARGQPVPYGELTRLLWEGEDPGSNTLNALKAILHRARSFLDGLESGAGRVLILNREGVCQWNADVPLTLDAEEFPRLCREAEEGQPEERKLALSLKALALYCGDFLPMLAGCAWAADRADTLHQMYLRTALEVFPLLEARARWRESARLSGAALALEPCREDLCRWHMDALLRLDRRREASQVYEELQERLLAQLGVIPSDALQALYREARRDQDPRAVSPVTLLERLREPPRPGALLCDFDFFRVVCHAMARRASRTGEPLHVALISVTGPEDLPRYSLDRVMDNLQGILLAQLRRGDAAARCGASQFTLLLPQASRDNSRLVCRRITRAFTRQFPHSPASLSVSVQPFPLENPPSTG